MPSSHVQRGRVHPPANLRALARLARLGACRRQRADLARLHRRAADDLAAGGAPGGWAPFKGFFVAFALFIGLCGLGHFLDMLAFFRPMYRLSGHVLVATGLVSCWTVWSLRRAWPALMAMKSPAELERVIAERTAELTRAIDGLRRAEADRALPGAIVESSDDAIMGKDLDGVVTSWNAGAERLFGYAADEAIGRPMTFLFPPDRRGEESALLERLGPRRERGSLRVGAADQGRPADRRLPDHLARSRTIPARIVGISKIARDISERKSAEEALTAKRGEVPPARRVDPATRLDGPARRPHLLVQPALVRVHRHDPRADGRLGLAVGPRPAKCSRKSSNAGASRSPTASRSRWSSRSGGPTAGSASSSPASCRPATPRAGCSAGSGRIPTSTTRSGPRRRSGRARNASTS